MMKISKRLKKENNREFSYRILRDNIMTLNIEPGSHLNELELSEMLSISRTPVHESIITLKNEYLIDVYPQSSSRVSYINLELLKEGIFMRSIAEPEIFKQIDGRVSPDYMNKLQNNLESQKKCLESDDAINDFFKLDDEFHYIIYEAALKSRTWHSIKAISSHFDRVRYIDAIYTKSNLNIFYEEHQEMYYYLLLGIPNKKDFNGFYKNHLLMYQKHFPEILKKYPAYFILSDGYVL